MVKSSISTGFGHHHPLSCYPHNLSQRGTAALRSLTRTASWWSNKRSGRIFGKGSGMSGGAFTHRKEVHILWVDDGFLEGIISYVYMCIYIYNYIHMILYIYIYIYLRVYAYFVLTWNFEAPQNSAQGPFLVVARDTYGNGHQLAPAPAAPVRASLHKRPPEIHWRTCTSGKAGGRYGSLWFYMVLEGLNCFIYIYIYGLYMFLYGFVGIVMG